MIINNNLANIGKTAQVSQVMLDKEAVQKQPAQIDKQAPEHAAKGVDITLSDNISNAFEQTNAHANSVNMSKVEELRQQIANGTLTMDVDKISNNFIDTELG